MSNRLFMLILLGYSLLNGSVAVKFSSKLIHRFSDEAKEIWLSRKGNESWWPVKNSLEYLEMLLSNDLIRQSMKDDSKKNKSHYQLFPSHGGHTLYFGNDFYWLHYTWIDIGTPNVSFLVALDTGSNMLWVPCDCIQCATLSASQYTSLGRDLSEYDPSSSSSSRNLSCNHELCKYQGRCENSRDPCPYIADYYTTDTSSSGYVVEDIIHLASVSKHASQISVQASVIIGCGRKQSGSYLDGAAPDGLMGLGLGNVSVPTLLAKAGLIQDSFSICFCENDSGSIIFGDQGLAFQHSTPFLDSAKKYDTYFVEVESYCIGSSCLQQSGFTALIDTGSSFTFLPTIVYNTVVSEFDKSVNAEKIDLKEVSWKCCYNASSDDLLHIPSMGLIFPKNQSFGILNNIQTVFKNQGYTIFCLTIMPSDGNYGVIGQNFMMGHRMVFDRENYKLAWSRHNCEDATNNKTNVHIKPPPYGGSPKQLPTNEQQGTNSSHAVAPAVAKRTPSNSSMDTPSKLHSFLLLVSSFLLLNSLLLR